MSEPTPEQQAVVLWLEDPALPTPSALEVERRFREVGLRSTAHAQRVIEQVKGVRKMADSTKAGGAPSKGTPADKRLKPNKPKK